MDLEFTNRLRPWMSEFISNFKRGEWIEQDFSKPPFSVHAKRKSLGMIKHLIMANELMF